MDLTEIKAVIELFEKSQLNKMEVSENNFKISLEKGAVERQVEVREVVKELPKNDKTDLSEKEKDTVYFNNLFEVKAPIVGVYFQSQSPDSKSFVEKGSIVKKGDVLCIIEAMKVMNEILADKDGEIVDICANNGQLVEFSQVLFRIK